MIEPKGIVHAVRVSPQFAAILDDAFDIPDELRRTNHHFRGPAQITSDGFVMCDFEHAEQGLKPGAFVCSADDLFRNARALDAHIRDFIAHWTTHAEDAVKGWIGRDWRVRH